LILIKAENMTYNLSSGATLVLRLFLPTVWLVFFGSFMMAGWLSTEAFVGPFPRDVYRAGTTFFVAAGAIFFRLTVWRLYRVDAETGTLFVSDYFRTFRYPRESVAEIVLFSYGVFHLCRIRLKAKGKLGHTLWFYPSRRRLVDFMSREEGWPFRNG
jgi:hypothetical protein